MSDQLKRRISSLAEELRQHESELKTNNYLSFFYIYGIVDKYVNSVLGSQPITPAGFNILHILILNGGSMIATEISKKAWRSKCSVTKVLDTLEKVGFVKRVLPGVNTDRRVKIIEITREGLDIVDQVTAKARKQLSQEVFQGLSQQQLEQLNIIFKQIEKNTLEALQTYSKNKIDSKIHQASSEYNLLGNIN